MTTRSITLLVVLVFIAAVAAATLAGWTWDDGALGTLRAQFGW